MRQRQRLQELRDGVWRRLGGAIVMGLGAVLVLAMALVATVALANFIELENSADAVTTVAFLTLPPAAAGLALIALGRWIHGEWRTRAPICGLISRAARVCWLALVATLCVLLGAMAVRGLEPQDQGALLIVAGGLAAVLGLGGLYFAFKGRVSSGGGPPGMTGRAG
ncbi:MAG: hypothetical protein SGJ21_00620 [Alphaproteobacteria bacterium]|nr:hypothetical protein [Alphaproteobacteria bacterium]